MTTPLNLEVQMPFGVSLVPTPDVGNPRIPEGQRNATVNPDIWVQLPKGTSTVRIKWDGSEKMIIHHRRGGIAAEVGVIPAATAGTVRIATLECAFEDVSYLSLWTSPMPTATSESVTSKRRVAVSVIPMPMPSATA